MFKDLSGTKLGLFIFAGSLYMVGAVYAPTSSPHRVAIKNEIKKDNEQVITLNRKIDYINSYIFEAMKSQTALKDDEVFKTKIQSFVDEKLLERNDLLAKIDSIDIKTDSLNQKYADIGDMAWTTVKSWLYLFE